ncbi:non-homologous end joining protein Ku [Streptomyces odontomachi]|uniref:non-homologous end joining protein Ku n=1 Tax=Streptomyces odontomachi TaxID=2944940 RepID=UPI00210C0089|nr:Ku protein [Streptomyces sp. ODS25]
MRSIWNGAISFGLVNIPIKLVNATESHSIAFRQIHTEDGGRIRYRKVCELEDREVTQDEIGRGYQEPDGSIVPITDDDLAALPIRTTKTVDIVAFVPAERIDPLQMGTAYYVQANGAQATKPYALLREALRRSGRVAIAKFALRGRERLGMLRVVGDVIAMHGLLWPDEIRSPEDAAPEVEVTVRDAELDLADTLMATLGEVDLDELHDDYRAALEELITAKTSGEPLEQPAGPETGGKVIDLMSALESSVRAARESRGEGAPEEEGTEPSAGRRRAARKTAKSTGKQAAKKTAATPARKTAERKTATAKKAATRKKSATTKKTGQPKKTTTRGRKSA